MRKSKFSEHQIISILKAVEAGRTVKDVCREHEISDGTYYQWKSKYGGMEAADIRRLRERQACAAVGLPRSVYQYEPRPNRDGPIIKLLLELAWQRPEQGFSKLFKRLRRLGHGWNHKRVYRIYCSLKLNKRRKGKKRLPTRCPAPLVAPEAMNECWSADFMSDALWGNRRFRTFNVVDDFNREAP